MHSPDGNNCGFQKGGLHVESLGRCCFDDAWRACEVADDEGLNEELVELPAKGAERYLTLARPLRKTEEMRRVGRKHGKDEKGRDKDSAQINKRLGVFSSRGLTDISVPSLSPPKVVVGSRSR